MEIEGRLLQEISDLRGTSQAGREWHKKEWLIETFDQRFPKKIVFQAFGDDRINALNLEVGKSYAVSIDIESHEWNNRWYTNVSAYNAREIQAPQPDFNQGPAQSFAPAPQYGQPATEQPMAPADENDDLPF